MNKFRINTIGKILEGENKGHYVLIQDDFQNTGGYLILISNESSFTSDDGIDYWVETLEDLNNFFEESKWKINWLEV
jgi:hypothetical protein